MVRRVRSRTQTAILGPHVVASAAPGVHRREWDACSASRSLLCGHEALRSSSQFAPSVGRRLLTPAAHAGKPPGSLSRPDGQPMDADTLSKAFRRLVASAKVTPITFHGLRHTHISHLLMEGVHVKLVSERAGHASINITLGVYAAY